MKNISIALFGAVALFANVSILYADEEVVVEPVTLEDASCQVECPEGQSRVSFADGARVSCVCAANTSGMVDTPEEVAACSDPDDDGVCG